MSDMDGQSMSVDDRMRDIERLERAWESGYADGYEDGRTILTDLIAELRALNLNRDGGMWADDVHDVTDRAEARLWEVSMSLTKGHDDE